MRAKPSRSARPRYSHQRVDDSGQSSESPRKTRGDNDSVPNDVQDAQVRNDVNATVSPESATMLEILCWNTTVSHTRLTLSHILDHDG